MFCVFKSWLWQFGGTQPTPIVPNDKSPIVAKIFVMTPNSYDTELSDRFTYALRNFDDNSWK